jgi:hypothetical protein
MVNRITMETVACLRSICHLKQNLILSWPWLFRHTSCIFDAKKNTQTKNFVGHPDWHIWQYCRSLWFSARSVRRISKSLYIVQIFRLPCKKNQPIYCQLTALYTYRIHITLKDMPVILHNFKQHVILKVLYKI